MCACVCACVPACGSTHASACTSRILLLVLPRALPRAYPLVPARTRLHRRLPAPTSAYIPFLSSPLPSCRREQRPRGRRQAGGSRGEREEGAEERRTRGRRMGSAPYPSPWRRRGSPSAAARPPSRRLVLWRRGAERSFRTAIGERERRGPPVSRRGERSERARGHATRRAGRNARIPPACYSLALAAAAALSPHSPTCHLPLSLTLYCHTAPLTSPPPYFSRPTPTKPRTHAQPAPSSTADAYARACQARGRDGG